MSKEYKGIKYSYKYNTKKMEYTIYFDKDGNLLKMIIVLPREREIDYIIESICKACIETALWYDLIKEKMT